MRHDNIRGSSGSGALPVFRDALRDALRFACVTAGLLASSAPAADAQGVAAAPGGNVPGWNLVLRATQGYQSNVRFTTQRPQDDFVTRLGAGLGFISTGPRGDVGVSLGTEGLIYTRLGDLNRINGSLGINGTRILGPTTRLSLSEQGSLRYTDEIDDLSEPGVLLPFTLSFRNRSSMRLEQRIGARTQLGVGVVHELARYRDNEVSDGSRWGPSIVLNRQIGVDSRIGVTGSYIRSARGDFTADIVQGGGEFQTLLSRRLSASLSGGLSRLWSQGRSRTQPVAGAGLAYTFRRGVLSLNYRHSVNQVFGLGSERVIDSVEMSYSHQLSRTVNGVVGGFWGQHRDIFDPNLDQNAQNVRAGLNWQPRPQLSVNANYSLRRREGTAGVAVVGHRAAVGVAYAFQWR
jgi:hypothetical protein